MQKADTSYRRDQKHQLSRGKGGGQGQPGRIGALGYVQITRLTPAQAQMQRARQIPTRIDSNCVSDSNDWRSRIT